MVGGKRGQVNESHLLHPRGLLSLGSSFRMGPGSSHSAKRRLLRKAHPSEQVDVTRIRVKGHKLLLHL